MDMKFIRVTCLSFFHFAKILSFTKIFQLNTFHFADMGFLRIIWLKFFFHFVNIKIFQSILIKLFHFADMLCHHIKELWTLHFTDMKLIKII